jgi:hypothetical protein
MRKPEIVALAALALVSPTVVLPGSAAADFVIAQADMQTPPPAAAAPAPAPPPAAANAPPTTVAPAEKSALSIPACSVKYLEAKVSGKLQGRKWVDFRRDECGRHEVNAVFPTAISPKYENEKDLDKARTKTCGDQFTANKATNSNGGLVWIEKDGGYYAECIIRLKG